MNTMDISYLKNLKALGTSSPLAGPAKGPVQNVGFLDLAAQLAQAPAAEKAPAAAASGLEGYKQAVWEKISQLPMSASCKLESISIHITDQGFAAMQADPEYEAWVLDSLRRDFAFQNPWTALCGGGYTVHHFGATKEAYRGESWYPGYNGGQGESLFQEKSKDGFWEQRAKRQEEFQKLQAQAAMRRWYSQHRLSGAATGTAELLMGLI